MIKSIFSILLTSCSLLSLQAQTMAKPGNFHCISIEGPMMQYWKNPVVLQQFKEALNQQLGTHKNLSLANLDFEFTQLNNFRDFNSQQNTTVTAPVVNFKMAEYSAKVFWNQINNNQPLDSNLFSIQSVVMMELSIQQPAPAPTYTKSLEVYIKRAKANGIGVPFGNLHFSAKGFAELMKKSVEILLDSSIETEQIEIKASPPFMGDNFIIGAIANAPKINIESKNLFSKYQLKGQSELLRWDEQRFLEIILKGKNRTQLSADMAKAVENSVREHGNEIHVFLLQDARNIILNKNYQLIIPARVSSNNAIASSGMPQVEPLEGYNNYLLNEKDTIAKFSILIDKKDFTKKLYPHIATNGIDSSSAVVISDKETEMTYTSKYSITGTFRNQPFGIEIGQYFREVYLNNERILIISGTQEPEKMVVLNPSIPSDLLNELILLGFNRFFQ
ncbi:hypothetical protein [Sediminibacterium salmoneum]|uniref:hypothetical protein n=1 Tax=Sediminibacterium salmoneum TaxID=426421 RepID=UPI000479679A|nr:hypothetical protein [Sediminibacterium salmoneum]